MRIRKRAVPLPLSLLSPVRLLQFSADSAPPADDLLIGCDRAAASFSPVRIELKGYGNENNKEKGEGNNHTSKKSDTSAVSDNGGVLPPPPPTPSNNLTATEGRWCEGDKAMPFKKRKVSLEFEMSKIGALSTKMKSKTNKKCPLDHHNSSDDSDYDNEDEKRKKKKKNKRKSKKGKTRKTLGAKYTSKEGRILMEGSRCSRVNGRGWRCLQPTLVGYSLCEHHLGKGRLRSISAVRVRAAASEKMSTAPASSTPPRASEEKIRCSDHHEDLAGGKKKKRKVGMVKARSLSSLLCQPETKAQWCTQLHEM